MNGWPQGRHISEEVPYKVKVDDIDNYNNCYESSKPVNIASISEIFFLLF